MYHATSGNAIGRLSTDRFQNDALYEAIYPQHYVRLNVYDNPTETVSVAAETDQRFVSCGGDVSTCIS